MPENIGGLTSVLYFLMAAVIVVPIFRRLRWSPVLGYLVAGLMIGPNGFGLIENADAISTLAGFGIVFLMFSIGLEVSSERLRLMQRYVFGLGGLQVLITGGVIAIIAKLLGLNLQASVLVGAALAFSSTAIVLQVLGEKNEVVTHFGRSAFAILLLQDLAVAPLLTLVPLLAQQTASVGHALGIAFIKACFALGVIGILGRLALRPLLRAIAQAHSPELFTAMALLVTLGTAWIASMAGLSMALGAFLAGLLLAETEYRHQVDSDIRPFRALLLSLFFTTVGMSLDPISVFNHWQAVVMIVVGMVILKAAILVPLARAFKLTLDQSLRVGLLLAGGGEFAFVLFSLGLSTNLLNDAQAHILTAAVAISMGLTPVLGFIGRHFALLIQKHEVEIDVTGNIAAHDHDGPHHVIIAGFGRVGQTVAHIMERFHIPFIALDSDPTCVAEARARGQNVFYGELSHPDVLANIGIARARAAIVTLDAPDKSAFLVAQLRRDFPHLPIIVRARDHRHSENLARAGATAIVPEAVEASLQLAGSVLRSVGTPHEAIHVALEEYRRRDLHGLMDLDFGEVEPAKTKK